MRVVHYYRDIHRPSGVTHAIGEWQQAVAQMGVETIVLHAGPGEPESWPGTTEAIPHFGFGRQTQVPQLGPALKPGDVLVLHEGWVSSNLVAARACRAKGIPYVVVPHGVYDPSILVDLKFPRGIRFALERQSLRGAAAAHVFYRSEQALVEAVGRPKSFLVAPTGYDPSDRRWVGGGGYVGWFGRYSMHHKGIDLLLRAYAQMDRDNRLPLRLHGPDYQGGKAQVQRLVKELALEDCVSVGAPLSGCEKWDFLVEADALVYPSRWESHSIALLEGLSIGAPAVVSSSVHVATQLSSSGAAKVVDMGDPDEVARGIQFATGNSALGSLGRKVAMRDFAWGKAARDFVEHARRLSSSELPDGRDG
ncbi:glycosyltransferase [Demequina rhizosphaerae]|uniref:glycosyltransferase n=1 Tax=Demequina rhizosphaerae TaxID=1638985 RepID=UPI000AFD6AD1|nr:glycosyltransferase [Demequina rhizosphaerae]